jgi:hypothetical protein
MDVVQRRTAGSNIVNGDKKQKVLEYKEILRKLQIANRKRSFHKAVAILLEGKQFTAGLCVGRLKVKPISIIKKLVVVRF